jgi:hypothetical protein
MIEGKTHVIVMGGKASVGSEQSLNTVYKLKVHEFISERDEKDSASIERIL